MRVPGGAPWARRREVAAYFQRFDEAESLYREIDRKAPPPAAAAALHLACVWPRGSRIAMPQRASSGGPTPRSTPPSRF